MTATNSFEIIASDGWVEIHSGEASSVTIQSQNGSVPVLIHAHGGTAPAADSTEGLTFYDPVTGFQLGRVGASDVILARVRPTEDDTARLTVLVIS